MGQGDVRLAGPGVEARHLARNAGALSAGYVVRQLLVFAALTFVAHRLGPLDFGLLNFAQALVVYFTLAATLGVPLWGTRELARQRDPLAIRHTLGAVLTARFALTMAVAVVALVLAPVLSTSPGMETLVLLYVLGMVVGVFDLQWAYAGLGRLAYPGVALMAAGAAELLVVRLFVHGPQDVAFAVAGAVMGSVAVALVEWPWILRHVGLTIIRPGSGLTRRMVVTTLPFALAPVVMTLLYGMDAIVLGYLKGPVAVGLFNAAAKTMLFLIGLTLAYTQVFFPAATRLFHYESGRLIPFASRMATLTVIAVLPVGVGGMLIAPDFVAWAYGHAFLPGVGTFRVLIWSAVLYAFEVHYSYMTLAIGEERLYLYGTLGGLGANLLLALALVPPLGGIGAALATVLAEAGIVAFFVIVTTRKAGSFGPDPRKILLAAANTVVMAACAGALIGELAFMWVVILAAFLYGALILVTRAVRLQDLHLVRRTAPQGR